MTWWTKADEVLGTEDLWQMQQAYYSTFYLTEHNRRVLAHLRETVLQWKTSGSASEDALVCQALDSLLRLIQQRAGIADGIDMVTAEAALGRRVPKPNKPAPQIEGFE